MRPGQAHTGRFTMPCPIPLSRGPKAGLLATSFDSIGTDSWRAHTPNRDERRQTEQPDRGSTKIPCSPAPHNTTHFVFWIQSVAEESRNRLRQPKLVHSTIEKECGSMATLRHFPASLFYPVFSHFSMIQDAAFMAYPEVKRCR